MKKWVCRTVVLQMAALGMLAALAACNGDGGPTASGLTASVTVTGAPCTAPASASVNCTFSASTSGGTAPFTYAWTFSNPANGQTVQASGQSVSPTLGCSFSSGVATFTVNVSLTVTPASGSSASATSSQSITRTAGACPAPLTASFTVTGTPCVAPSAGNVTCTFTAVATGGQGPFTYAWTFTNPANAQATPVAVSGQTASPALGCGFSTGVVTFNTSVSLTITPASGTAVTTTGTQSITRAAGACGT